MGIRENRYFPYCLRVSHLVDNEKFTKKQRRFA